MSVKLSKINLSHENFGFLLVFFQNHAVFSGAYYQQPIFQCIILKNQWFYRFIVFFYFGNLLVYFKITLKLFVSIETPKTRQLHVAKLDITA